MIATNNLGIYTAGLNGTFSDMAAPKRQTGRRRPPLEEFTVEKLQELLASIETASGLLLAAKKLLSQQGEGAKVKVNYAPAVREGIKAIGWLAEDVNKKIGKGKTYFIDEGSLPHDDEDLPATPSKNVRPGRNRK